MSEGTTPKFAENAKYADWFEEYNFDNCKLNREEYTCFLANYLTSEQDGFVLNLNGSWGTGKTHFLKRLYTHLLCDKRHPTIYIDAWESDFIQNPLAVISSELLNQLSRFSQISGKDFQIVKDRLGTLLRSSMIGLAAVASKSLVGDSTAGAEFAKEMMSKTPSNFLDDIQKDTTAQVAAIPEIRKSLTAIAEVIKTNTNGKAELPVVVLIDELDRCRPNYAIELLEVVKHFFTTEKFVFVIASDTEQLKESIKTVYGSNFEAGVYLKRFFDQQATLQKPEIEEYLNSKYLVSDNVKTQSVLTPKLEQHKIGLYKDDSIHRQISEIASVYDFKLRDIEQLISRYNACLKYIDEHSVISPTVLLVCLANQHPQEKDQLEGRAGTNVNLNTSRRNTEAFKYLNEILQISLGLPMRKSQGNIPDQTDPCFSEKMSIGHNADRWVKIGLSSHQQNNYRIWEIEDYRKAAELSGTLTGMDTQ